MKDIRRQTRRQYSAEVLVGPHGEENISELCRREGIAAHFGGPVGLDVTIAGGAAVANR